jgi:hypothetical protein
MANFVPINNVKPFNSYIASTGETTFVFDWFVFKAEYVLVYKNGVLLQYNTEYNIPINAIGSATGGVITLIDPCEEGDEIVISRKSEIKRTSGYTESGEFRAGAINLDINYVVSLIQEINFKLERSISLSPSDSETTSRSLTMPKLKDRLSKYLAFDNNGNLTAVDSSASIDLVDNWVRKSESSQLEISSKKIYTQITTNIILKLPIVESVNDGMEILILNLDTNTNNTIVNSNSAIIKIDGATETILAPGEYKKFIYNHSMLKWFTID